MPDDTSPAAAAAERPPGRTAEREFRQALKRLGLSVAAADFELALAGYCRVMLEIATVRQHLRALQPDAAWPADAPDKATPA
jgi:hypothetical protein